MKLYGTKTFHFEKYFLQFFYDIDFINCGIVFELLNRCTDRKNQGTQDVMCVLILGNVMQICKIITYMMYMYAICNYNTYYM